MDNINILQWNIQSILCNQHILSQFLLENNIHIAIICETWLKSQPLKIKGYNIERNDLGNKHNGVAILIHTSIVYKKIDTYFDDNLQNICVQISIHDKLFSIVSFYIPPNSTFDKNKFDSIVQSIPSPMIVAGDFNAHHTSWGCHSVSSRGRDLLEIIDSNNLIILNDGQPTTTGTLTWRPNGLDLTIVSPSIALLCDWWIHDDPMGSFHFPVMMKLLVNNCNIRNNDNLDIPQYPNYKKVDWHSYSENVEAILKKKNFDFRAPLVCYNEFCDILQIAIKKSIPNYKQKNTLRNKKKRQLPWWNYKCTEAVQQCKEAFIKYKNDRSCT